MCLNPYSTGSWVAGYILNQHEPNIQTVLILILLEVGLLVYNIINSSKNCIIKVLILILLEVGLLVIVYLFHLVI